MTDIALYYAPDNASLIVRIVLEELGLPYQSILVDRSKKEQRSDEYLSLNPTGLIPACVIDGDVVTETAAIVLTLAESADSALSIHRGDSNRSGFLRCLFFLSNTLHPDLRHLFYAEKYVEPAQEADYRSRTRTRISAHLAILEKQYAGARDIYLFGDDPTIIDIYLAVILRWLQLYPQVDRGWFVFKEYPSLHTMLVSLQQREAVIRACQCEGITGKFFTEAEEAQPSEGSAL